MPPRAKEWIEHLGDVPIPPRGDVDSLGMLELDWGLRANHRGSCPMLHTLFINGKAQSAWDPMPQEALVEYLETISKIPYSFSDIVEEYLPGVFDPIRPDPTSPRWYPKPILVAACVFAERRILQDPRTTDEEDSDSDDGAAYPNIVGATLHNRFSRWDQSDTDSTISCPSSIGPDASDVSDSDNEDAHSDRASTCSDGSACSYYSDLDSVSSCSDYSDEFKSGSSDCSDCDADDSECDADAWDVKSITVEFQQAMNELERRGLELHLGF